MASVGFVGGCLGQLREKTERWIGFAKEPQQMDILLFMGSRTFHLEGKVALTGSWF